MFLPSHWAIGEPPRSYRRAERAITNWKDATVGLPRVKIPWVHQMHGSFCVHRNPLSGEKQVPSLYSITSYSGASIQLRVIRQIKGAPTYPEVQ